VITVDFLVAGVVVIVVVVVVVVAAVADADAIAACYCRLSDNDTFSFCDSLVFVLQDHRLLYVEYNQ